MKIFLCLLFILSSCTSPDVSDINPIDRFLTPQSKDNDNVKEDYLVLVNTLRQDKGLQGFIHSEYMNEVAQLHADNMAQEKVDFGHSDSIQRCESVRNEFWSTASCGEIIAKGSQSPDTTLKSWLETEAKSEILNPSYTHTGIGIARNSQGSFLWVQIFLEVP